MARSFLNRFLICAVAIVALGLFGGELWAQQQPPTAMTVPFVASNPTTPHTSWAGNPVILKGAMSSPYFSNPFFGETHTFTWDWNPGDGGPHCTGTIDGAFTVSGPNDDPFVIACPYTYNGSGPLYTAVLNVTDTTNGLVAPAVNCPPSITTGACYYTSINPPPPNLPIEINNAIDNGLWYLHTYMNRTTSSYGALIGNWTGGVASGTYVDTNSAGDTGPNALDCEAFEVSGFLPTNYPPNVYSEDVGYCLAGVFDQLATIGVGYVRINNGQPGYYFPSFNPDGNNNGIGVEHNGGDANYQTGMMLDAIVAAGTPTAPVPTATTLGNQTNGKGSGPGGQYLYQDAVQDMVDDYSYCENPGGNSFGGNPEFGSATGGGWHYSCQETTGDNSVSQWAAIGIIPARRTLGSILNPTVLLANQNWLDSSFYQQTPQNGYFGYTSSSPIWGPYADTPSGLVQLAMNGLGRGTTSPNGTDLWDSAETFIRDNFGNDPNSGPGNSLQAYYYGMFSFTKAMLLHDNSGTGLQNTPITTLQSMDDPNSCAAPGIPVTSMGSGSGPCYPPIDWYAAQTAAYGGTDPINGVARTIVNDQIPQGQYQGGSWFGQSYSSNQYYFQTPIAIIMLNRTVFQAVPVACFTSSPSHVASGGPVQLNGNCSVEQNPLYTLVSWQWDISGTGAGYSIGPGNPKCLTSSCSQMIANFSLPAGQSLPNMYPARLLLTDSGGLTATVIGSIVISNPPNPPSASAGGPYNFCPNTSANGTPIYAPFLLNGSGSTNPDQGTTDGTPGAPPSTIISYLWDYSCSGQFSSASGVEVNATAAFDQTSLFGTSFNVCLQVTNNDNLAYPTAGLPAGLSSVASASVTIHQPTDSACSHCVMNMTAGPVYPVVAGQGSMQLTWTDTNSAAFPIAQYNVYRSTSSSFNPYIQIAGANSSPFVPAVPVSNPPGGMVTFIDTNAVPGTTYYYRVDPATSTNTETCQGNIASGITDTPPTFTPPPNQTLTATSSAGAVATYTTPTATDAVNGTLPVTCLPASGSTFGFGVNTVTCSATNTFKMSTAQTFTVTVLDAPPMFTPPPNQTVDARSDAGAVVNYATPTATDFKDGTDPVICLPASGSTFPLGVDTVTCTATNSSMMTTTGKFMVTVVVGSGAQSSITLDLQQPPAGATLWFNSTFKVVGAPTTLAGSHLYITAGTISFGTTSLTVPDSIITFTAAGVLAKTTFDTVNNIWNINVPYNFASNIFLGGLSYQPLPRLPNNTIATWSAEFATDFPAGLTVQYADAVAAYSKFAAYGAIGVKTLHATSGDGYPNSDQSGTPENEKSHLVTGGTGSGGTNYTGTYSKPVTQKATVVQVH